MSEISRNVRATDPIVAAIAATTFTWALTALSAAVVFFFTNMSRKMLETMLGFTGGVMVAAAFVVHVTLILPYALSFAAGAMIYVVVEEVIPESQRDRYTDFSTLGFILGFVVNS